MPADPDAPLAVQPAFALAGPPRVLKNRAPPLAVPVAKDHVRNQLLEPRVLLHFVPRTVTDVVRAEERLQVPIHVAREPLKVSQAAKQLGRHDQHSLGTGVKHSGILSLRHRLPKSRRLRKSYDVHVPSVPGEVRVDE